MTRTTGNSRGRRSARAFVVATMLVLGLGGCEAKKSAEGQAAAPAASSKTAQGTVQPDGAERAGPAATPSPDIAGGAAAPGDAQAAPDTAPEGTTTLLLPEEKRLANLRQLTFGGQNAEAYFDETGQKLVFQSTRDGVPCDQIFTMNPDGSEQTMVSTGKGRTTCSYLVSGAGTLLYASTHLGGEACPPEPDYRTLGYVWPLYESFDIFAADLDGGNVRQLTTTPGYDAEATAHAGSGRVVFTSVRDGDLDLYSMHLDGSDVKRLTTEVGYDGGAFFSADGTKIVYRAERPTGERLEAYQTLLKQGLYRPGNLEIYVMNADGTGVTQLTNNGQANFAPFFHPDGTRVIFASNVEATDPHKRNFDLYMVRVDGTGLERITTSEEFDGFPMFSPDGTQLVFASNRGGKVRGETNIFTADWVDAP